MPGTGLGLWPYSPSLSHMIKQTIAAISFTACCLGNPAMASTSATAVWNGDQISNSCSLSSHRDGRLALNSNDELDSTEANNGAAVIKTNVIGTATLKATQFQALRGGGSILAGHHKADIKYGNAAWDQIFQNTLDQNQTPYTLQAGRKNLDVHIRSNANKAQDQSVIAGTYTLKATLTCYSN